MMVMSFNLKTCERVDAMMNGDDQWTDSEYVLQRSRDDNKV